MSIVNDTEKKVNGLGASFKEFYNNALASLKRKEIVTSVNASADDLKIKEIQNKKISKLKKREARVFNLREFFVNLKIKAQEQFELHGGLYAIDVSLTIGAIYLHAISFSIIINVIFPGMYAFVNYILACVIATGLDLTGLNLFRKNAMKPAFVIFVTTGIIIIFAGIFEVITKENLNPVYASARSIMGFVLLIALIGINTYLKSVEFELKRKKLNEIRKKSLDKLKVYLVELKTKIDSEFPEILSRMDVARNLKNSKDKNESIKDIRIYFDGLKGNFNELCKVYNLYSAQLAKVCMEYSMFTERYFRKLPKARSKGKRELIFDKNEFLLSSHLSLKVPIENLIENLIDGYGKYTKVNLLVTNYKNKLSESDLQLLERTKDNFGKNATFENMRSLINLDSKDGLKMEGVNNEKF